MAYKTLIYMLLSMTATTVLGDANIENNRPNLVPRSYYGGYSAPYGGYSSIAVGGSVVAFSSIGNGNGGFVSSAAPVPVSSAAAVGSSQPFNAGPQSSQQFNNPQPSRTPGGGSPGNGGGGPVTRPHNGGAGTGGAAQTGTSNGAAPMVTAGLVLGAVVGGVHLML